VVLAGQGEGGIKYLKEGKEVELKYEALFATTTVMDVEGFGKFESYPNRDSLRYISEYGLDDIATMLRGTLRIPPYCKGWNALVLMGFTQEAEVETKPFKAQTLTTLSNILDGADLDLRLLMKSIELYDVLEAYTDSVINPAKFLQAILEQKWVMKPGDKDLVVMVHQITYMHSGILNKLQSSFVNVGKDEAYTAMATTVGLPVAMGAKLILNGEVKKKGVIMPKYAEIYNPILAELKQYGIIFNEQIIGH
jgi:saccharopine dehydrogenase-like NADP-dependent oxidoreductase